MKNIRNVYVIFGSTSDIKDGIKAALEVANKNYGDKVSISVLSCFNHLPELHEFLNNIPRDPKNNCIVVAGSMDFALPGIIRTILNGYDNTTPVIGVAMPGKEWDDCEAACLSISKLPGQPVIMKEDGLPYVGEGGFWHALTRAAEGDVPLAILKKSPPSYQNLTFEEIIKVLE